MLLLIAVIRVLDIAVISQKAAFRFAKGDVVVSSLSVKARLERPLDFLVVSEHSENLGLRPMIAKSNPIVMKHPRGKENARFYRAGDLGATYSMWGDSVSAGWVPVAIKRVRLD